MLCDCHMIIISRDVRDTYDYKVIIVPYRLAGGTLSLLAVCQSDSPFVRNTSVFQTFLCSLLRY